MFTLAFGFSLLLVAAYQGSRARDWTTYITALVLNPNRSAGAATPVVITP